MRAFSARRYKSGSTMTTGAKSHPNDEIILTLNMSKGTLDLKFSDGVCVGPDMFCSLARRTQDAGSTHTHPWGAVLPGTESMSIRLAASM